MSISRSPETQSTHFVCWTTFFFLTVPVLLSGCGAFIVAGAGAGAYTYISGNVIRTYSTGYNETIGTCTTVLNQLRIEILEQQRDRLKTSIRSTRYDGAEITITIEKIGRNVTQVGIRTGLFGINKKTDSELIHQYISDHIVMETTTIPNLEPQNIKTQAQQDTADKPEQKETASQGESDPAAGTIDTVQEQIPDAGPALPTPRTPLYIFYDDQEITVPLSYQSQIDSIIDFLRRTPSSSIDIRSYTDPAGDAAENRLISTNRALAVKDYFINRGIAAGRIIARGYGASNFLESNKTEALRRMNRRVEIHLIK